MNQLDFDFTNAVHTRENNSFSEAILFNEYDRLSNNCRILLEALLRGEKLTGAIVVTKYGMLEYRRRFADLRKFLQDNNSPIKIQEETIGGGCKCWFINK